ncbi:putative GNAT family acetyltransferase [Neisseria sp. HSC-16F19]|nr:GNAT family N-acetyltransferase [Neisseria sp. HSC-16F19]MCP2039900.1 putative GNAT family acetyltransferase [Neisseria sp. HSC-16F19]
MHIEHSQNAHGGRFQAAADGQELGHLDYVRLSDTLVDANHTWVSEAARGRGVADALLQALAAFAAEQQLSIRPSCSYVAKKLPRSHPELLEQRP